VAEGRTAKEFYSVAAQAGSFELRTYCGRILSRQTELESSDNPFAIAVLAHLKTLETRGDAEARLQWKAHLARLLFARNWSRREIEELLQFLDWLMSLPEQLEDQFETEWTAIEREHTMAQTMPPLIRRAQDRGKLVGRLEGKRDTLIRLIRAKFGPVSQELLDEIDHITDVDRLDAILDAILSANSVSDLPFSD
jgi:hypothetical protein